MPPYRGSHDTTPRFPGRPMRFLHVHRLSPLALACLGTVLTLTQKIRKKPHWGTFVVHTEKMDVRTLYSFARTQNQMMK